ncbi:MAG: alpha/beta fold hydrolase [Anaerolineae bacterium]
MKRLLLLGVALVGFLVACSTPQPSPAPVRESPVAVAAITSAPTDLPAPTATTLPSDTPQPTSTATSTATATATALPPNPLQIEYLRQRTFTGSDIKLEQTLQPGANYSRYIASYQSDGLKIYGLLTIPNGPRPKTGWPTIVFNHGYIPPSVYRTTERYVAYVDLIARAGYIVFKIDYRGHASSEGTATGGYGSPDYTIDSLNALASLKKYPDVDPNRIGEWGHSMGGQVVLRSIVVSTDVKASVIWGGVVASYPNIMYHWRRTPGAPSEYVPTNQRNWRQGLINQYGTPDQNPQFWASVSPNSYVADIAGPVQLDVGGSDEEVPVEFSQELYGQLQAAGKTAEFYTYPGSDHNISQGFALAMQRTIAFFDKYVKQ